MATLYIVGTPIGNLEDVTLRALRVLREADIILCEDTRVTRRLLEKYEITGKQLIAYNEQKSGVSAERVIGLLQEGKSIALVTDAGTPGISDPGSRLVQKVRVALPEVKIESVPGPSALTAALSVAGVSADNFLFLGFLPHKKGRETLFKEIADTKRVVVFYESPHRILKTLSALSRYSTIYRTITVCRELTKIYEEVKRGAAAELLLHFQNNPDKVRGEFVVIVSSD